MARPGAPGRARASARRRADPDEVAAAGRRRPRPRQRPGTTTSNPILAAGIGLTAPVTVGRGGEPPRRRGTTLFGDGGPVRGFLGRWGFPLFVVVILVIGRRALLPFVFASLIAYILAPVIRWMSERKDGSRRMPRGLAIILCYLVFLSGIVGFGWLLIPRLAKDVSRIGKEAPALYKTINDEWVPELAHYLEKRFPTLRTEKPPVEVSPVVPDVPMPPGTAVTMTPLPDGRWAIQLSKTGVVIVPEPSGGFRVLPSEAPPAPLTLEEKLRTWVGKAVAGLQSQVDDLVRFGQALVTGVVKGVFTFFLVLMIAAFMLIDMEKVHAFLRSLFPPNVRDDYDVIIAGIDRGLSGVIRGQLLICLVNGILTYIGLMIFDVKYALVLAFVAALMSLIPIFGSILSTIPIVFAALVSGEHGLDFVRGVAAVLWIVGIHFIEANFLNPNIIGTSAKIHPVVVIFSLILGEKAYGLVGALLAVPVASMIQVLFLFFYRKTWKKDSEPPGGSGPVEPPAPTVPSSAAR
ncbi:MAG: AI-2E family transporter [Kofleriaceae bacterium]|nr:AI-2E family transporter [Kofleriaceae bacterium]